jgi:hypothetical protein
MNIAKITLYGMLFSLLFVQGCDGCYGDAEEGVKLPCQNIDPISKEFTFEVYAKYRYNNQPIQGEGQATVVLTWEKYLFQDYHNQEICIYDVPDRVKFVFTQNFDESGKAIVKADPLLFKTKYDKAYFSVSVNFPHTSDIDQFINTEYGTAKFDSEETYILFFSYLSENDL